MRVLGVAIKARDIIMGALQVDTWLDTIYQLLKGYQYGPRFFATVSAFGSQVVPNATATVIEYGTGTANPSYDDMPALRWFNPATQRFTPLLSGYYQINASVEWSTVGAGIPAYIAIYKNGVEFMRGSYSDTSYITSISTCLYLSETDYIQIVGWQNSGINSVVLPSTGSFFNGYLARPA
jgi:hypothetical protein